MAGDGGRSKIGTSALDYASGVSTDSTGAVYIAGLTNGSLGDANAGGADILVAKLTSDGVPEWTRTLGTSGDDQADAITVDEAGNPVTVGNTAGELVLPSAGGNDAIIVSLTPAGATRWTQQFGTPDTDAARGVTISQGRLVVVGQTNGNLDPAAASPHGFDGFVAQFEL
jgi:Beta-propeller repeat